MRGMIVGQLVTVLIVTVYPEDPDAAAVESVFIYDSVAAAEEHARLCEVLAASNRFEGFAGPVRSVRLRIYRNLGIRNVAPAPPPPGVKARVGGETVQ